MALQELLHNRLWAVALIAAMGCNQVDSAESNVKIVHSERGDFKIQNGLMYGSEKLYSGAIYTLYPGTKNTAEITGFKNGKENGTWKEFFIGGKLKAIRQ